MGEGSSNDPEYERLFGSKSPGFLRVDVYDGQKRLGVEGQITEISVESDGDDGFIAVDFKAPHPESHEEREVSFYISFDVAGVLAHSILAAANMGNNAEPPSPNPARFVFKTLIGPPDTKV